MCSCCRCYCCCTNAHVQMPEEMDGLHQRRFLVGDQTHDLGRSPHEGGYDDNNQQSVCAETNDWLLIQQMA